MYFDTLGQVLQMDGHGAFVWAAYGITLAVVFTLLILPRRREQRLKRELAAAIRRNIRASATAEEA